MRYMFFVAIATAGCLSAETKIFARRIADSATIQHIELAKFSDLRLEAGAKISETQQGKTLLKRAEKLKEATAGLADILGAPKEVD